MNAAGPRGASVPRTLAEGIAVVAVLFPPHFFTERPAVTVVSSALIVLLFFLPPLWAMVRLRGLAGPAPRQAMTVLGFGVLLGLGAGVVGAAEKYALTLLAGERFPVPLPLWLGLALAFATASGAAYAAIMFLGRGIAVVIRSRDGAEVLELLRITPGRSRALAALYSLIPGLGQYFLGNVRRGRAYLLLTLGSALTGLLVGLLGLILLIESGLPTVPLLVAGLTLLLLPGALAAVATLDALVAAG